MFDEINLRVIDAIFTSCEPPIKAFARSLYLNCLINEFKKRKAVDYSKGFEISISDIKEFSKYEKHFAELEQSGLCEIDGKKIIFWNVWDEHLAPKGYKQPVGGDYLSKPIKEFENAIKENIAKGEKKESAILSKVERMEILSGIARNADPYHTMTKDDYGREVVKDPPTISERIKSIDILNKMEGEYRSTVNVKHEHTLHEMVLQSYKEDITPVEVIEAEYLELRKAENSAPIEPEKTEQTEPTEELFI